MKKMNACLSKNIEKITTIFLWIQPVIDILTTMMLHTFHRSFTIGMILRMIFLLLMCYHLLFLNKSRTKKKNLIYLGLIFLYFILYTINIIVGKGTESIWYEWQNLLKCFYFPILLICFFECNKPQQKKQEKQLSYLFLIYLFFVLFPNTLNLGFESYEVTKKGSIGWFYTANEIGAILSILMPFYFYEIQKYKNKLGLVISIILIFYTLTSMGTKSPLLCFFLLLGYYFIKYMIHCIKEKKYKVISALSVGLFLVIGALILIIPKTTFYQNIIVHLEFLEVEKPSDLANFKTIDHFIFSQRLSFLKNTAQIWLKSNLPSKLLGIGYIDYYSTDEVSMKMIEMDYFDIFFRQGIFGFLLIIGGTIVILLNQQKKRKTKILIIEPYLLSITFALLLALLTGHVLISPSVSIYVALIFNLFYNERNKGDKKV